MIFLAPWLLLALAVLPVLWWLLRVTPPAPKTQSFPAIRLLLGLRPNERTAARTPWWLLLLRLVAAALVIVGLAGPVLDAAAGLPGQGPLLLVIDDGWAAAPDWTARMQAAANALDRAERAGRQAALLTTARSEADGAPKATPAMPVPELRTRLAALRPKPWPPDRDAAAQALAGVKAGAVIYVADGVAADGDDAFARDLSAVGHVSELRPEPVNVHLARPPQVEADRLVARVSTLPQPAGQQVAVLAQTGDGRTLARAEATVPPQATSAELEVKLPPEIRNAIARLVLEGSASAGSVVLLDERWRRRPVGLLSAQEGADTPLIGPLFYTRRALAPTSELREGSLAELLERPLSVLVLADMPLEGDEAGALVRWVEKGGLLIRFAGPRMAEASTDPSHEDPLLPVPLLAGDRQLGGALSWSQPAGLSPFPPESPFNGLAVPAEVLVTRQVLAEPSAQLASRTWASLADGTPLVTAAPRGAGRVVLFGVTGNADWSNLPLSGLFVDMLRRLVDLSAGVAASPADAVLPPVESLDGFGALGPPPQAATGITGKELQDPQASPRHPPGIYGPQSGRRALNLGAALPELRAAPPVAGAAMSALTGESKERALGPPLLAAALGLLALDLLISLGLRGLLRLRPAALALVLAVAATPVHADELPALSTRLAYVQTGDATVDAISKAGLTGLSEYVNRRTAVTLADPVAITPGQDDLSFYPLLYWPITADTSPSPEALAALNEFTSKGGIILIDTRSGGSGEGFAPGTDAALRRASVGLAVPPLAPLTSDHVLARAFYLLQEFPGRFAGDTVWVQRDQDRANDSVSPVIIGGHDWAGAWAVDASGRNPYATIPGGARQRTLAYRFGVNLVMYALTGNYKGDQVHVPAILERLGQ
ncbi:MAG: DUF4159 domain-containing protein [Acetobacteraceae bacterium]|nr:DUF4159 domain-containing protein [Acetobacteraceae bacterium]